MEYIITGCESSEDSEVTIPANSRLKSIKFNHKEKRFTLNVVEQALKLTDMETVIIKGVEYNLVPVVAPVGRWKPAEMQKYFMVTHRGDIRECHNNCQDETNEHYAMGLVFETREQAIAVRDKILLRVEIHDYADKANAGKVKDGSSYIISLIGLVWFAIRSTYPSPGVTKFYSHADAKSAIDHFGSRLDILK